MDNPLPCPFCGQTPHENISLPEAPLPAHVQYVWCNGPKDRPHGRVQMLKRQWNVRHTDAPPHREVLALYADVRVKGDKIDTLFPAGTPVEALLTHLRLRAAGGA